MKKSIFVIGIILVFVLAFSLCVAAQELQINDISDTENYKSEFPYVGVLIFVGALVSFFISFLRKLNEIKLQQKENSKNIQRKSIEETAKNEFDSN